MTGLPTAIKQLNNSRLISTNQDNGLKFKIDLIVSIVSNFSNPPNRVTYASQK